MDVRFATLTLLALLDLAGCASGSRAPDAVGPVHPRSGVPGSAPIALTAPAASPSPAAAMAPAPPEGNEPERLALRFVAALRAGDVLEISQRFDETMWSELRDQGLSYLWPQILEDGGDFTGVSSVSSDRLDGLELVHVLCGFELGQLDIRVAVTAWGKIHGLAFAAPEPPPYSPPSYVDPATFGESELGLGSERLPARLTLPHADRPVAAVVLVLGSGPQDHDATLGPNRPFRDLAWGLSSRGIAVLRFDKRTKALAGKLPAAALDAMTLDQESVEDAEAGVRLLRHTVGVDPTRIVVLGHSLGGVAAARVAARDPLVAGFVILAGPARPLEDVLLDQYRYVSTLHGKPSPKQQRRLGELEAQIERVKSLGAHSRPAASELPYGLAPAYWLDLAASPPAKLLAREQRPVLVLQGDRDYQVTHLDFELWQQALRADPAARFVPCPGLNHLFMAGTGPASPSDYQRPGHVAESVVRAVAEFVRELPRR